MGCKLASPYHLTTYAQESNEHDEFRVGTAKLGTKKKPQTTPNSSNISGTLVDDKLLAKQMGKAKYAHLPLSIKSLRNPQKKREALVNWFAENLIYLHNAFPADLRARATHWYDGARILSERFADKFDTTPEQVAGVMAALSPQKDWFMNVAQAEQLIDIWTNHQNTRLTDELVGKEMQSILDGAAAPAKQKKRRKTEKHQRKQPQDAHIIRSWTTKRRQNVLKYLSKSKARQ